MHSAPLEAILERSFARRRVLVTGHNGFVGSWLCATLARAGASVVGVSLPARKEDLADVLKLDSFVETVTGDINTPGLIEQLLERHSPEIVFHLAAQALVLTSYEDPLGTFETNIMGTARILDALRRRPTAEACVVVTSDKCYSTEVGPHREDDPMGGDDPYSASKGAAEIVAHGYRTSFFEGRAPFLATARAGNIVGGGDWADHRIVPDCVRAVRSGAPLELRHPSAVRPWQHVLDAVAGYLRLADALLGNRSAFAEAWNFGPSPQSATTVQEFVLELVRGWRERGVVVHDPVVHAAPVAERDFLLLDSSKARARLGWEPRLDLKATASWTVDWYAQAIASTAFDGRRATFEQIDRFLNHDTPAAAEASLSQS